LQADKYGVVINYAIIVGVNLFDYISSINQSIEDLSRPIEGIEKKKVGGYKRVLTMLSLAKILCFNFIFKNHTDESWIHQKIHIGCVVLLGALTVVTTFVQQRVATDEYFHVKKFLKLSKP
jgi:uncharacterized membrane protein